MSRGMMFFAMIANRRSLALRGEVRALARANLPACICFT